MELLYMLEEVRVPWLDRLMLAVTSLGEETFFLVMALILFWCVEKRQGYCLLAVGLTGTILNQMLKLACRVPRPWILDPEFTIVEQARDAANGYSFPSGHSQSAVGTLAVLGRSTEKKVLKWICIVLMILVPFSRMYLGVHTLADVAVGSAMAVALALLMNYPISGGKNSHMKLLIAGMITLGVVFLLYVELWPFPAGLDAHNLQSAIKNAYTMLGCLIGFAVVYVADTKWLNFSVKAVWWVQIIKVVVGLLLVLAVKEGLRAPLDAIFSGHMIARGIRYFLIVVVAGVLWPMSFRALSNLGKRDGELK